MALNLETISLDDYLNYFNHVESLNNLNTVLKDDLSDIEKTFKKRKYAKELLGFILIRKLYYDKQYINILINNFLNHESFDHGNFFDSYDDCGNSILRVVRQNVQQFFNLLKATLSELPIELEDCLSLYEESLDAWYLELSPDYWPKRWERQRLENLKVNTALNSLSETVIYTHECNPITGELYNNTETPSKDELIFITRYNLNVKFVNRQSDDVILTEGEFYEDELSSIQAEYDKLNTEINSQVTPAVWDIKHRGWLRLKITIIKEQLLHLNKSSEKVVSAFALTDWTFISKELHPFQDSFKDEHEYNQAIASLGQFFNKTLTEPSQSVLVKGKLIRKLSFALGEIWRSQTNDVITYEYLDFSSKLFSNLNKQKIDKSKLQSSNLYKYFISET